MTAKEALRRATGFLGKHATASEGHCFHIISKEPGHEGEGYCTDAKRYGCDGSMKVYRIGVIRMGMLNSIQGAGSSWEEALELARAKFEAEGVL